MIAEIRVEQSVMLSPLVRRVTQDNPGLMTGPGTNTYLVGGRAVLVIDPGENTDRHFRVVLDTIGPSLVQAVAPTHGHRDHWPLSPRIAAVTGAETVGFAPNGQNVPMRLVKSGELIETDEWIVEAVHTPGHSGDHLCYWLREERALFSGDHILGWSTSVIARPDGSLNDYLNSLNALLTMDIAVIYPGHGDPIVRARERIEELIAHRHMRTGQILEALRAGDRTVTEIVKRVYYDVDSALHPMAEQSVQAHLDALVDSGQVQLEQLTYRLIRP